MANYFMAFYVDHNDDDDADGWKYDMDIGHDYGS